MDRREVWVRFAAAAAYVVPFNKDEDWECAGADIALVADILLNEYERRFGSKSTMPAVLEAERSMQNGCGAAGGDAGPTAHDLVNGLRPRLPFG